MLFKGFSDRYSSFVAVVRAREQQWALGEWKVRAHDWNMIYMQGFLQ
ncbi:hypothetical protein DsansV1_C32g0220391 [Dioscorea sansibarensis]